MTNGQIAAADAPATAGLRFRHFRGMNRHRAECMAWLGFSCRHGGGRASVDETSQEEWGYTKPTEEACQAWLPSPHFQPELWQIAWDMATGQVAGHVLTFIQHAQNEKHQRKRGYTEGVGIGRA